MSPLSVRRLDTDREDPFDVSGHIKASDVGNIYSLLEGAHSLHDEMDMQVKS